MAYWGEAMTYNHPVWAEQNAEAARKALANITATSRLSPREAAYVGAVRILYGEGDKLARDQAYERAMQKIYLDYPDDLEAAAFYSLALLGAVRPVDKGFSRQMRAGAIALEVYRKNPNHPGAAHYVIHSFDDPEHAILALPAAREYAKIAPAANHAQHMPSHIFFQLGMWPEAAASNETAWRVSEEWVSRKHLDLSLRDYHSYYWLTYVYCQQGRYEKAENLVRVLRQTITANGAASVRRYDDPASAFIIESQKWQSADELMSKPPTAPVAGAAGGDDGGGEHAHHGGPATQSAAAKPAAAAPRRDARRAAALPPFIRAYASASRGDANAEKLLSELRSLREAEGSADAYYAKTLEIRELEVSAVISAGKNDFETAITTMKRATALEEEMAPPSGPAIKPSHELFGEILLRAGKGKDATMQFAKSLERQPNRARSLIGMARACAASGDKARANEAYSKLVEIWRWADADLPELKEAKAYLARTK